MMTISASLSPRSGSGRRVAPTYGEPAARTYGESMGYHKAIGRPLSIPDGQIAATARTNGLTVATRNTSDFENCGIELINPFLPDK